MSAFYAASPTRTSLDAQQAIDFVMVSDTKAAGSNGDTVTASAWTKVSFNTEDSDVSAICSLSSSVITLAAGTYEVDITVPSYITNSINLRLRNTTDSATTLIGGTQYNYDATYAVGKSRIVGKFTIAGTKNFEVQYYSSTFVGVARIGYNVLNSGESVQFSIATFQRIAH